MAVMVKAGSETITTRTCTRASRTTCGWSPARTSASSTTTIRRLESHRVTSHLADQIENAGLTWKSYQESMGDAVRARVPRPLRRQARPVRVLRRHQRLGRHRRSSRHRAAPTTSSTTRSSTPTSRRARWPTTCSSRPTSTTTCTTARADGDAWLAREVPKILDSDAFKNGGVLFLLWDEGGGSAPATIRRSSRSRRTPSPARLADALRHELVPEDGADAPRRRGAALRGPRGLHRPDDGRSVHAAVARSAVVRRGFQG